MEQKIKLTNSYHQTEAVLIAKKQELSAKQVRRAWKELCGIKNCACCNIAGQRGFNSALLSFKQDGSALVRLLDSENERFITR